MVVAFQLALAAGAPWGRATMGGKYPGTLPRGMRIAAVVQALLLVFFALIALSRAGLALPEWHALARTAIWFVVGFSAIATLLNTITPSKIERSIWAPVSLGLLATSLLVALG